MELGKFRAAHGFPHIVSSEKENEGRAMTWEKGTDRDLVRMSILYVYNVYLRGTCIFTSLAATIHE